MRSAYNEVKFSDKCLRYVTGRDKTRLYRKLTGVYKTAHQNHSLFIKEIKGAGKGT